MTTRIQLYSVFQDKLLIDCCQQPPKLSLQDAQTLAKMDAEKLYTALDNILPYGTWKEFLDLCCKQIKELL